MRIIRFFAFADFKKLWKGVILLMYSIGDFAKICCIPIHTLRFWEKEGLLLPEKIDETTGYRFYGSRQLYSVQKIKSAKLDKFKNKEIRSIVENPVGMQILLNKREELIKTKTETEDSIRHLDFAINILERQKWPEYNFVVIKSVPEGTYITHRQIFESICDLLHYFVSMYNFIWEGKPTITDPYECFAIYYDNSFSDKNLDAECCVKVNDDYKVSRLKNTGYQIKKIPGFEMVASCFHYGPHELIGETFAYLMEWIKANEFWVSGYPLHNVISNETTPDISNYEFMGSNESQVCEISEIIVPIKKRR